MNADVKRMWIEDLRSGEFPQAKTGLRTDIGYCCLGVLCERFRRETGRGAWSDQTDHDGRYAFRLIYGDGERNYLPPVVATWAGLEAQNPIINPGGSRSCAPESAAMANDGGFSFERIADLIERNL